MNWDDYKIAFEFDGSWRDIYVLDASLKDWKILLEFLAEGLYPVRYLVDDVEQPLEVNAWQIFEGQKEDMRPLMWVDVEGVMLKCHFFDTNEIEFDIDPREVVDEKKAEAVFDFMKRIGDELGKSVILTEENGPENIWFSYDPATGEMTSFELY